MLPERIDVIELAALGYKDLGRNIGADEALAWERDILESGWATVKTIRQANSLLLVCGQHLTEGLWFSDEQLSLICLADLLQPVPTPLGTPACLAQLYKRHGDKFVNHIRGTFSLILFDHRERVLKAWIDHFGSGRIVYIESLEAFVSSTHLGLLQLLSKRQGVIDPAAIMEYLQYSCIPPPRTIYKDIYKLEPGQMWMPQESPSCRTYWDAHFAACDGHARDEEWWSSRLHAEIETAVRKTVKASTSPDRLGCFLSGGTDSSSIAGLVGKITGASPRTFSIGFDDPRYNEIRYARIAARQFRADHHEYFVTPRDIIGLIRTAGRVYDEPFGNSSVIPTYYCARLAAEHGVTHLLAGDGGDELFGGNERYVKDPVFERYSSVPLWLRKGLFEPMLRAAATIAPSNALLDKASRYVRRASLPLPDRLWSYAFLSSFSRTQIFDETFLEAVVGTEPMNPARRYYFSAPSSDYLNRWLYLDLKITIGANDLRKVTRMTQLSGVTVRYPFLNPDLAAFAGEIPPRLKIKGNQLRFLFKKAMSSVLPQEVIQKPKHGFGLPYSVWVGEDETLKQLTFDLLGSTRCRGRGYFQGSLLEGLWDRYHAESSSYYGEVLWVLLMLEMWHLQHHDAQHPV